MAIYSRLFSHAYIRKVLKEMALRPHSVLRFMLVLPSIQNTMGGTSKSKRTCGKDAGRSDRRSPTNSQRAGSTKHFC